MPIRNKSAAGLFAAAGLTSLLLQACSPKPDDQAVVLTNETSIISDSNSAAALDTAAAPSAGSEAANLAAATDPGPPPANIADVREAAGDEGSLAAKNKVSEAAKAGRLTPPPRPPQ